MQYIHLSKNILKLVKWIPFNLFINVYSKFSRGISLIVEKEYRKWGIEHLINLNFKIINANIYIILRLQSK